LNEHSERGDSTVVGPPVAPILEVVQGNEQGRIVRLKLRTRVGRERDNELVLTDPRVSRYHAIIELDDNRWVVRDQNSANGTFVNAKRISAGRVLQPDDRIVVGDTEMVFQPSRVGAGSRVEPTMPGTSPEAAGAARAGARRPRWGWQWLLAGGLALLVVVAVIIVVAGSGLSIVGPTSGVTSGSVAGLASDYVLVYEDDFSDPNSGWDDAFDRHSIKQYGNNKYYIEITTSNLVAWGLANRDVADFRLEVDATQEAGPNNNGFGILFRFQDRDNYYRFDISGEGYFLLSKFYRGEWTTLIPWTASSALNVGQATNRLMVEAIGNRIRLFANGTEIGQTTDDALGHGNFGFFANTFTEANLIVSFDNIKLWVPRGEGVAMIPTPTRTPVSATPTTASAPGGTQQPAPEASLTATSSGATSTPTAIVAAVPTPVSSPTPLPLPDYTSRDAPPARNAVILTGRFFFPLYDPERGTFDIYACDPDGANRELVVREASQPAVNADGQRIVYRSWRADGRGLVERAVSGGAEWRFNSYFEAARPAFAPDGQSFLFHSREAGEPAAIYHTTGERYEVLRRDGAPIQGQSPAWVDSKRFVYQGCLGNTCGLIVSNLDGSFPQQITQDPGDTNPDVSPDGQQVVFMSRRGNNWDVYRVGIDGSNLTRLTTDPGDDGLPIWSPDGKTVAFVSNRDGMWEMWAMDGDGDNERPLFDLKGTIDGVVSLDVANSRGWVEEHLDWSP
jgi:Tol biopolymer transport system component